MIHTRFAASFALACITALTMRTACADPRAASDTPRAVIELFTSQGCSSCPPADKLIAEYSRDPSVIALSLAVDYWDYLGWKDTLALSGHTSRQRAYAKARGDRQVYTPQAVIDGAVHALGSDRTAIDRAIRQVKEQQRALTIPVAMMKNGDTMKITVPAAGTAKGPAEVWLCPVTHSVPVSIKRGENSGHTITYTNVVRRWVRLGDWSGKEENFTVPMKEIQTGDIDSAVVLVQSGVASSPRIMLGAAQIGIR